MQIQISTVHLYLKFKMKMKKILLVACALTILGGASFAQTATTTKKVETKKEVKHVKKHHPKKHVTTVKTVKAEKTATQK